jgi:PAS domain S-box-containing protein
MIKHDGSTIIVHIDGRIGHDEHGQFKQTHCILYDITERKRAEELRNAEERFSKSFRASPNAMTISRMADGKIFEVNDMWEKILGYSREESVGISSVALGIWCDPAARQKCVKQLQETGSLRDFETDLRRKTGEVRKVILSSERLEIGGEQCLLTIIQDITERKQAEEAMRREHNLLRLLIDNLPDRIYVKDCKSRFILGNDAVVKYEGFKCEKELLGKTDVDLYPEKLAAIFYAEEQKVTQKGQPIINEERLYPDKQGNEEWTFVTKVPLRNENGKIVGLVGINRNITEHKRVEKAFRESEARYRALVETAPDVIYTIAQDGTVLSLNSAFEKITGWSRAEWLGKHFAPLVHPDDLPTAMETFKSALCGKTPPPYELRILSKSGEYLIGEFTSTPHIVSGKVVGELGIVRNVTERKQAEEALRREHNLLRLLIDNLHDRIYVKDCKSRFILGNDAVVKYEGFKCEEELLGKTDFDLYPKEWAARFYDRERQVIKKGQPMINEEGLYVDKQGNEQWVLVTKVPLRNENGKIVGLVGINRNITERKRAEEALRKSEYEKTLILDNASEIIAYHDTNHNILWANRAYLKATGLSLSQIRGKKCYHAWGLDRLCKDCPVTKSIETGKLQSAELTPQNQPHWPPDIGSWLSRVAPVKDETGNIIGAIEVSYDITERKKAEEKLLDYQGKLKSLASQLTIAEERERRRIAADLHDRVSQSIAISKIKLDGLRHKVCSDDPSIVLDEVCRLLDQAITDVRSLTFDLSSPILAELGFEAAVAAWLTDEIERKYNIAVELEEDKEPKPLDDETKSLLFRNVREVLTNVVKHSKASKVKVSICRFGDKIRVSVEDNGVGFVHAEVTAKAFRKGGFGLFSIKERLEGLGGSLQIDSKLGHGCRIVMIAPLKHNEKMGDKYEDTNSISRRPCDYSRGSAQPD